MGNEVEAISLEEETASVEDQLSEALESQGDDQGDGEEGDQPSAEEIERGRRIAVEECLHTIANFALELEAGQRESISAEDIRTAFATHDLEEIWEETKIFFGALDTEEQDFDGEEAPDLEEGEESDE